MYYFKEKEKVVEKYLVSFPIEEVSILKGEIIEKCSEIKHHEYDSTRGPNQFDSRIRNYHEHYVGIRESRDTLQYPDEEIYHYSYDEYEYPYLVSLIDKLLKGNVNSVDEIFSYDPKMENKPIVERIIQASDELDEIDNLKIYEKKKKLEELQKLVDLQKLNENQESIEPYFIKLKKLIKMDLVDTITKEEIERVNSFYNKPATLKEIPKVRELKK